MLEEKTIIAAADLAAEYLRLPRHAVLFKDTRRGKNFFGRNIISIPRWVLETRPEVYGIYYAVHEICHSVSPHDGHGKIFKTAERKTLAQFGIEIFYARAYPKKLTWNGETQYSKERPRRTSE